MQKTTTAARVAAFFAAFGVTTLMVLSQFSLAQHYVDAGGLLWAGQAVQAPVAQIAPAAVQEAG
ncbi:MAG: hypothetical protein H6933_01540 [Burkholderiaceae bacterium]|nr:hypothetical protein [Rhodoferax sp.]MCP5283562.1 hypothetical protein [Burkholderiaceae bacterium]